MGVYLAEVAYHADIEHRRRVYAEQSLRTFVTRLDYFKERVVLVLGGYSDIDIALKHVDKFADYITEKLDMLDNE